MGFLAVSCALAIVAILLYLFKKWRYSYWDRKGVHTATSRNFYGEAKQKGLQYIGSYSLGTPILYPIDLELIKCMLIKNFDHFLNRGMYVNERDDPLTGNLFAMENEKWRHLRIKLSPTFTSGKMKMMFNTMTESVTGLVSILENYADKSTPVEIKDAMMRYTIDIIGSAAFGIDCNAVKEETSEFKAISYQVDKFDWRQKIALYLNNETLTFFRYKSRSPTITNFFMNLTRKMIKLRDDNNIRRNDFLQLLMQLRDHGEISEGDDLQKKETSSSKPHLSLNEMAAQCFIFFNAGFSTSSSVLSLSLFELSRSQEIQEKLRQEVRTVLKKHGEMTYDAIMEMEYLDKVVNESLRMHPPARANIRVCNKAFKVPGQDYVIEPGTTVHIPTFSIQRDPEYYPDPDKFDPERFSPENKAQRHPMAFQPFGEGPRICIGFRFAYLQVKVGLATILSKYRVTLNEKTALPMQYDPKDGIISINGGNWLNIHRLN